MCHNTACIQRTQIENYVKHGMPQKIVKTVKYTLRKRAEEQRREQNAVMARVASINDNDYNNDYNTTVSDEGEKASMTLSCNCNSKSSKSTLISTENPQQSADLKTELKIPKLCGRNFLAKYKQANTKDITNIGENQLTMLKEVGGSKCTDKVYVDALATGTQLTKRIIQRFSCALAKYQSNKIFTLLTRTTQPAHLAAICILSFVIATIWPDFFVSTIEEQLEVEVGPKVRTNKHILAGIAYLGAFAIHFGAQIWMTFVSGLSLYFSLPRHTFGQCQQILFPKYFALNSVLSIGMLILFIKYFLSSCSNVSGLIQLTALTLTAIIEVTVRLYLAPPMLTLMHEKYKIEGAIGSGQEVGTIEQGDLIQCPHYQRIHKAFRRIHMIIAMGNMAVLLATCIHLYFLASKIQIN